MRASNIKFTAFRTLCDEKGLTDPLQQDSLARILHAWASSSITAKTPD
ncbi:hypothetical protein [Verrucomicrobium spinosum]|nr:hypothetical protein [Verrucomicrobium spinosum]